MNRSLLSLLAVAALVLGLNSPLVAAEAENAETRLRENLKASLLQLRSAQNELAAAQSAQNALTEEKKTLTAQNDALKKQAIADHLESDKAIAELKATNADQVKEIARLNDTLAKTKAAFEQAAALARAKETERARLASELIVSNRRADDLHVKNVALCKLGGEILVRFEKFGIGDAIGAREPFVGLTRVKLENLVQDYGDKLAEQRDVATP